MATQENSIFLNTICTFQRRPCRPTVFQQASRPVDHARVVQKTQVCPTSHPQKRSIYNEFHFIDNKLASVTAAAWNSNHSPLYYIPPRGFIPFEQTQVAPHKLPPLCSYLKYYITPLKLAGFRRPEKPKQHIRKTECAPEHQRIYSISHINMHYLWVSLLYIPGSKVQ